MSGLRVVSFDCGNKNTGCVIVDIDKQRDMFEIVSIELITSESFNEMSDKLFNYIKNVIDPQVRHVGKGTFILYENVHSRYLYPNWSVIRMQKHIREHFETFKNIRVLSLKPTQKTGVGGTKSEKRKTKSVELARQCLSQCGCISLLDKFNSYERNHDIADALLAVKYLYDKLT